MRLATVLIPTLSLVCTALYGQGKVSLVEDLYTSAGTSVPLESSY